MSELHYNHLRLSFDELMKHCGELLLQQQVKTIRTDPEIISARGREQTQMLSQDVTAFHNILDRMEITLLNSQKFLVQYQEELLVRVEREKREKEIQEKLRQQEEEAARLVEEQKRKEHEERDRERERLAREEAQKREQQLKLQQQEHQQQQQQQQQQLKVQHQPQAVQATGGLADPMADFGMDLSIFNTLDSTGLGSAGGAGLGGAGAESLGGLGDAGDDILGLGLHQAPAGSAFSIDAFEGLDSLNNTDNTQNNAQNNAEANTQANTQNNTHTNTNNNTNSRPGKQDDDQYLTLNDFNDFGIDWNSGEY